MEFDLTTALVSVLPTLAGPASAVVVLLVVGAALYSITVRHIIPLVGRLADRHLAQIDQLMARQTEITEAFKHLLERIEEHLDGSALAVAQQAAQMDLLREIRAVQTEIRTDQLSIRQDVDRLSKET